MSPDSRVVFWGAGATASLRFKTTLAQSEALRKLVYDSDTEDSLDQRVRSAVAGSEPWCSAFQDLLTVLGDGLREDDSNFAIKPCQLAAMRRNWRSGASDDELQQRITHLRTLYDWPGLQAAIRLCPNTTEGNSSSFKINDLFNLLDMHGQSGHGFRKGHDRGLRGEFDFLTPQQVVGARNALKMLLQAMFYVDWQRGRRAWRDDLEHHYEFAKAIGRRMQRQGINLAHSSVRFDSRSFYMSDVSFVSLNYDPVAIWCQYVANRDLNESLSVPHVGSPALRLRVFHDLGHFVASSRVKVTDGRDPRTPWYPMNESAAQRLNDDDHGSHDRIRIMKFLLPHGCLWWRECPNCGKLSSYMGHSWDRDSAALIPPPPFRAFVQPGMFEARFHEQDAWDRGEVDARACVHCQNLTYAHHTQTRMQSNFKDQPPPFLEEISRDLRVAVQEAHHIILMGYTLPTDDVDYRAFFAARRRPNSTVKCSVVVGTEEELRWLGPSEWPHRLDAMKVGVAPRTTLEAASDLFGKENVRFFGGGIPQVFLDGGRVTEGAVERLLNWDAA